MKVHIGLMRGHVGGLASRSDRTVWPPQAGRDEWWEEENLPTVRERVFAERCESVGQVIKWLFVHGGMSVVFLFGLMACGVVAAFLQAR